MRVEGIVQLLDAEYPNQLATSPLRVKWARISPLPTNVGTLWIGGSSVYHRRQFGEKLDGQTAYLVSECDLENVWISGPNVGDAVSYVGETE